LFGSLNFEALFLVDVNEECNTFLHKRSISLQEDSVRPIIRHNG